MSALLEELESRGVTAEDLEKAASVRLFEKAAAAEGVNLETLDQEQIEELYSAFINNNNLSSSVVDEDNLMKEANAMNEEIVELFEKQAEAEGIDLETLDDVELANMYNHYVENVLPEQIETEQSYEVEEAHAKLAEAEILGRHMARAYADESEKIAATMGERAEAVKEKAKSAFDSIKEKGKAAGERARSAGKSVADAGRSAGRSYMDAIKFKELREGITAAKNVKGYKGKLDSPGKRQLSAARKQMLRGGAKGLLAAGGTAAAGYGGYKGVQKMTKKSSYDILEENAEALALEFLSKEAEDTQIDDINLNEYSETEIDNYITERAVEMLIDAGYDFE